MTGDRGLGIGPESESRSVVSSPLVAIPPRSSLTQEGRKE